VCAQFSQIIISRSLHCPASRTACRALRCALNDWSRSR